MSDNVVWFGTREFMQWVKSPAVNVEASRLGWTTNATFLNGGAYVKRSRSGHKNYVLSWNTTNSDMIRTINDYAEGVYGTGLIYWLNPAESAKNALPQYVATPSLGAEDGVVLSGETTRPTLIATPANGNGYPTKTAVYTLKATTKPRPEFYIPIPPNYTAWVGIHGANANGVSVVARPYIGADTTDPDVALTLMDVDDVNRFNTSFSGNTYQGISIALDGTGTIELTGLMVQVLPDERAPEAGGFISGQGHSGCEFSEFPELTQYNAAMNLSGLSAELIEVGAWQ